MPTRVALLEVIVCTVADAVEAEKGGAKRLEIVSDLERGGLTPSLELVREILTVISVPVRVMLRENDGYEIGSSVEMRSLINTAAEFSNLRLDGLVLGFLQNGRIDLAATREILQAAPRLTATFHHAFEELEPLESIAEIKKLKQIDRILSHGGAGDWTAKMNRLAKYQMEALPELEIIAGGGLTSETIGPIAATTAIREFHVGRAARTANRVDGSVQAARVKGLVDAANGGSAIR